MADHDAEAGDADVPEVVAQSNGEVSAIPEKPNEPEPSQPSSAERLHPIEGKPAEIPEVSHRPATSGDSEPPGVGVGQLAVSPRRLEPGGDLAKQSPRPSPRPNPWAATPKSQDRREEADGASSESPRRQLKPASTGLSKVSRGTARTGRSRGMSNSSSMSTQQLRDHIRNKRAASQASQDAEASWPDPRKYAPRSLYLFNLQNPIRKVLLAGLENPWWDRIVLGLIFLNTIQLLVTDPLDVPDMRPQSATRDAFESVGLFFTWVFTIECFLKIFALGFIRGHGTYLANGWNWLDFFIVCVGLIEIIVPNAGNLTALRALRVMRPLRAITRFPELQALVMLLLNCIPQLSNVIILCLFIFFVFGILGVQLFKGCFRGRCYSVEDGATTDEMCSLATNGGMAMCGDMRECLQLGENSGREMVRFDDIGGAIAAIFQLMTTEGWADMMYETQDTVGRWTFAYYVVLMFAGPICAVNLFLVVMSEQFAKTEEAKKAAEQRERDLEKAMTVTEMAMAPDGTQDSTQGQHTDDHNKNHGDKSANIQRARRASQDLSEHSLPRKMSAPGDPAGTSAVLSRGQSAATAVSTVAPLQRENSSLMADMPQDLSALQKAQRRASLSGRTGSMRSMDAGTQSNAPGAPADPAAPGLISEQSELEGGQRRKKPIWRRVQWQLRIWAKSDGLQNFVLSVIVLNTIVMASDMKCEFDGSDDWCKPYKAVLEMFNIFFALVFTVELVIKMVGLGPRGYAASRMNLFDGLIVLVSDYEIISANSPGIVACYLGPCPSPDLCNACPGEGGGFAVLRAFRLVRLVKLLRAFPDLQKQVKVLGEVMQSIVWLIILVMILVLIFFVLGMNLFGGQVAGPWDPEELPIALGSFVWVTFPNDVTSAPSLGRYGRVMGVDVENRTFSQWHVYIKYGEDVANKELFQGRLGLDSEGKVWCATQDDVDTGLIGMPYISSLPIRLSFDNAWLSAITTFQLITMANWNDNLYDVTGTTGNTGYALYFYALITVGNWMLLNLFIAILIQKFAEQKAIALAENITRMHESMVKEFGNLTEDEVYDKAEKLFDSYDTSGDGEIDKYEFRDALATIGVELGQRELVNLVQQYDTDKSGAIDFSEFFCMIMQLLEEAKTTIAGEADQGKSSSPEPAAEGVASPDHQKSPEPRSPEVAPIKVDKDRVEKMAQMKRANSLQNMRERGEEHKIPKTCWVLRDRHPLRLMCRRIAQSKPLDQVVLAAIGASCCCLVIERPDIGDDSPERAVLKVVDIILNTIFTFEFLVKMIDQTFTGYLKSGWNRLDFMIVFTSAIDMFVTYALASLDVDIGALKMFRVFRIFRALRPLRIIARMRGLRILVSTLMSSAKPVAQTCAIAGGVFLIGGILGMQFLMGKMDSCSDGMVSQQDDCIGLDDDGEQRTWGGYYVNFDNTYRSMISMFIIATQDDWVSHMWAGIDATEARQGPFQNNAPAISIFYIGMIFASALVVVNIFVGVFVDCYLAASAEMDASQDPDLKPVRPKVNQVYNDPDRGFKKHVFQTISHTKFDMFIAFFIVTNVISMAFDTFKPHQWQQDFDVIANFFYTIIFGWECLFKMYCLNSRRYFVSGWNKFDFFIVMVSFGGIFIDSLGNAVPINPTVLRILRIFRIFRILRAFRIFKSLKGLQAIVMTLGSSLPAIMNLFSFLMLLFFIYSIIGVMVFGSLCRDGDQGLDGLQAVRCLLSPEDLLLDPHATFETVMWSLLTLFRVATGDAWGDILDQCAAEAPHGPNSRPVLSETWSGLKHLLGDDPANVYPAGSSMFERFRMSPGLATSGMTRDATSAMDIAKVAIWHWNATSFGQEASWDWPYPADDSRSWIVLARMALPTCLHSEEAAALQDSGLMECQSSDGYSLMCATTCGTDWIANIYFMTFFVGASFVLLQLVIAVLMEQLIGNGTAKPVPKVAGTDQLRAEVFQRIYWRWNLKARMKLKVLRRRDALRATKAEGVATPGRNGSKARRGSINQVAPQS